MKFVLTILIAWYGNIVLIKQFLISFSVQLDSIQPKVFLQFLAIMEHSTSWMHQMFCLSYIGNGVTILPKQRVSSLFLPVYIYFKTFWNSCDIHFFYLFSGYQSIAVQSAKNGKPQEEIYWFSDPVLSCDVHFSCSCVLLLWLSKVLES